MPAFRVLIIGAYGQFGRRIATALAGEATMEIVLAGRDVAAAETLARSLGEQGAVATLSAIALDIASPRLSEHLRQCGAQLVIHTAGPFQGSDYRVARAAVLSGAHYIDLADGREFVAGIGALSALAKERGRWVISGASSVPGLSAAVVAALLPRFRALDAVESAISPGNRTSRGLATTRAILGYVGRPFPALIRGRWRLVFGWQSLRRLQFAGLGARWFARCDVPDLTVLPARYPDLRHCDFRAGLELRRMHFGLWTASWLIRARLMPGLEPWAGLLLRTSERWLDIGSDTGVMAMDLTGMARDGSALRLRWQIEAAHGSGPQIPATAAIVLARKLARESLPGSGATPCLDLFSLEEFLQALAAFPIRVSVRELSR